MLRIFNINCYSYGVKLNCNYLICYVIWEATLLKIYIVSTLESRFSFRHTGSPSVFAQHATGLAETHKSMRLKTAKIYYTSWAT